MKFDGLKINIAFASLNRVRKDLEGVCLRHLIELKKVYNHPGAELIKQAIAEHHKEITGQEYNFNTDYKSNYQEAVEMAQGNMRNFINKMNKKGTRLYSQEEYNEVKKELYGDKKYDDFHENEIRKKINGEPSVLEEAEKILMEEYVKFQQVDIVMNDFQINNEEHRSKRKEFDMTALDIFRAYLVAWERGELKLNTFNPRLN